MKKAEISAARESNPSVEFAVKVPKFTYGRRDGSEIVKSAIEDVLNDTVYLFAAPTTQFPETTAPLRNVLDTWERYSFNEAHEAALREDRQRDFLAAYDRERAERAAWIEGWLPAFAGLTVPAGGTANFDRDDVDLSERLRETFIKGGAAGSMFRAEDFAPIAERINALSQQVLDAGSGWGGSATDTGQPTIDPLDAVRAKVESMTLYEDTGDESDAGYEAARSEIAEFLEGLSA